MDPLRQQILEHWSHMVTQDQPNRREVANKYRTKKIMLRAHGMKGYYDIRFAPEHQALSFEIVQLIHSNPLIQILHAPQMIGILGSMAEIRGDVDVEEVVEKKEKNMHEDMFFDQHFAQSLTDSLGGANRRARDLDNRR